MPSKRYKESAKFIENGKSYPLAEAVVVLKKFPRAKFDESVDLSIKLNVDPKQSEQMVRGTVPLPHGTGKQVRVVAFAEGAQAEAARAAGAEHVGFKEIIAKIKGGWFDFDIAVATPDAMQEVRKLGKELGPKGLMPNPKTGTVSEDMAKAIREFKAGRVEFKMDKNANLHVAVGKASFEADQISANARAVIEAVVKSRPSTVKGIFLGSCTLSTTMSPGVPVDLKEFLAVVG
ncbi:MAG: 50S ribosomal protein L1 [Verrucomicrobiae bacterium]|nr:50S ribosomal protein L1 [Verrucomicrobiae bacterium]